VVERIRFRCLRLNNEITKYQHATVLSLKLYVLDHSEKWTKVGMLIMDDDVLARYIVGQNGM
jgi:hypothetical protein